MENGKVTLLKKIIKKANSIKPTEVAYYRRQLMPYLNNLLDEERNKLQVERKTVNTNKGKKKVSNKNQPRMKYDAEYKMWQKGISGHET